MTPWPFHRVSVAMIVAAVLTVTASGIAPQPAHGAADAYCTGDQLAAGANWSVCWDIRAHEGLVITHAFYTKPGFDRRVLSDAAVAQVFVPYETGSPRYHDVAYGLGQQLQRLDPRLDCPGGTLLAGGKVCRVVHDRGLTQKLCLDGDCHTRRGKALSLSASSQMGAYNYITRWEFHDDGVIEPAMGLGGALQFGDTDHTHNVYWRLDFDIDDPGGDQVEEFYRIAPSWSDGSVGVSGWAPLLGETYRPDDLLTFRKWRVVDVNGRNARGHNWGYELVPSPVNGTLRTTPAEGFTRGEFWVTHADPNERFVSTDDADLLSTYIDGDPIQGEDVVVWYAMHEYHEVRDEDRDHMPVEWMSFHLQPRSFFDKNPLD